MTPDAPPPCPPACIAPAAIETPAARLARLRAEVRKAELDVVVEKINAHRKARKP